MSPIRIHDKAHFFDSLCNRDALTVRRGQVYPQQVLKMHGAASWRRVATAVETVEHIPPCALISCRISLSSRIPANAVCVIERDKFPHVHSPQPFETFTPDIGNNEPPSRRETGVSRVRPLREDDAPAHEERVANRPNMTLAASIHQRKNIENLASLSPKQSRGVLHPRRSRYFPSQATAFTVT